MSDGWNPEEPEAGEKNDPPDAPDAPERPEFPAWPVYGPLSQQPGADEPPRELLPPEVPADRVPARPSRDPLAKLFPGLPRRVRMVLDWILTIAGAVLIVLALKQWVVNPYRIPSSSMEPTLNCAKPASGCLGDSSDRVLACRICLDISAPSRGDIIVFNTPRAAVTQCGEGGTFVKRLIGLPGEKVKEDAQGFIWIRGPDSTVWTKLSEPYIQPARRRQDVQLHPEYRNKVWSVPAGDYFFMGDNRGYSCDSRQWGSVPRNDLIGTVFFVYWPPDRIGFR